MRPAALRTRSALNPGAHLRRGITAIRACAAGPGSGDRNAASRRLTASANVTGYGTIVMPVQLLCGAGYELWVIALTTSAEMNA